MLRLVLCGRGAAASRGARSTLRWRETLRAACRLPIQSSGMTRWKCRLVNPGPLSHRTTSGLSLWLMFRSSTRVTRRVERPVSNTEGFSTLSLRKKVLGHHGRFGLVPNAAGPWSLSNDSTPWSFDGGLRPFPPGYSHDSIFDITASARVPPLSPHVCPRCPP